MLNNTPITEKIIELANRLLIVFSVIVDKLNLTDTILNKFPMVEAYIKPETLTLVLTVIVGLLVISVLYGALINVSKFTLNFLVFLKWATVGILIIGVVYSIA